MMICQESVLVALFLWEQLLKKQLAKGLETRQLILLDSKGRPRAIEKVACVEGKEDGLARYFYDEEGNCEGEIMEVESPA